jgi:2-methylcitrate dehydratase
LGAILAVADWLDRGVTSGKIVHSGPKLTMHTLLTALIKAYEIQGCFLLRNAFNTHGLDHVILVKLASTAVVSWLLGLTEEETMAAISHVWMDGHPLRTYRQGTNTTPRKGWAAGDACMRAVQLAFLTQAGQPGSKTALTAPRWGFYDTLFGGKSFELPKPYGNWVIENVIFKVMPVEGHGIAAVQASLQHRKILRARGLMPEKHIKKIEIRTMAAAVLIINKQGPLNNAADRDHCMQYMVALAFLKGAAPEAEDYKNESPWASDANLAELRSKVHLIEDKQLTDDYMNLEKKSLASGVTVFFTDGTVSEEILVEFPVGHVRNPETAAVVKEKFRKNIALKFSNEEAVEILEAVEMPDMGISEFVDLFVRNKQTEAKL